MSDREKLAALERENASLLSRIEALEAKAAPKRQPPAPIDEGVKVTTGPLLNLRDAPTAQQYEKLLEIVAHAHPQVVPKFEADRYGSAEKYRREYLGKFISCFERLGSLWRFNGNELGRNRAEIWVADTTRMLGISADVGLSHVMSAAIAWGDVPYTLGRWPYDVFAGLSYSSGHDIRSASSASWRKVLESGAVRPAIITNQKLYDTPQPRIQQLLIRG